MEVIIKKNKIKRKKIKRVKSRIYYINHYEILDYLKKNKYNIKYLNK